MEPQDWNLCDLPFVLPQKLHNQISTIALPFNGQNENDTIFWNQTKDGNFTIKSTYNLDTENLFANPKNKFFFENVTTKESP